MSGLLLKWYNSQTKLIKVVQQPNKTYWSGTTAKPNLAFSFAIYRNQVNFFLLSSPLSISFFKPLHKSGLFAQASKQVGPFLFYLPSFTAVVVIVAFAADSSFFVSSSLSSALFVFLGLIFLSSIQSFYFWFQVDISASLCSIVVSVFVVILVKSDKYWDEQACRASLLSLDNSGASIWDGVMNGWSYKKTRIQPFFFFLWFEVDIDPKRYIFQEQSPQFYTWRKFIINVSVHFTCFWFKCEIKNIWLFHQICSKDFMDEGLVFVGVSRYWVPHIIWPFNCSISISASISMSASIFHKLLAIILYYRLYCSIGKCLEMVRLLTVSMGIP